MQIFLKTSNELKQGTKKTPTEDFQKQTLSPPDGQFVRKHSKIHRFILISEY